MYIGKTPFAFCLTLTLIAISHFSQGSQIESVSQHAIDLNRQTYNRLQLERSQDKTIDNEQIQKLVALEVMRATSSNKNIKNSTGEID
ncbi:hypothetical protein ABIA48_004556 [Pseudomonas sp. S30_BP2TU TE3576]|uniref:hypothetical protein n=1 Tax=Pseudomonas sp. S30_BP2TU TE3576 TaxID=3349329 RepID=UPI003D1BCA9E